MKKILFCSSNQILIKSIYGSLRDDGHEVEITEHPAFAVQKIMASRYDFLLIDSEPFGLSAEDAVDIIRKIAPKLSILFVGSSEAGQMKKVTPVDLEELKRIINSISQMA